MVYVSYCSAVQPDVDTQSAKLILETQKKTSFEVLQE